MPWNTVMHRWGQGDLKSGGGDKPVKSQKQAVAIMLSEKRAAKGGKKEYQSKAQGKTEYPLSGLRRAAWESNKEQID